MQEFTVNWSIEGSTKITASDHAEAQRKFQEMGKRDLAEDGELLQHNEPETEEDLRLAEASRAMNAAATEMETRQ